MSNDQNTNTHQCARGEELSDLQTNVKDILLIVGRLEGKLEERKSNVSTGISIFAVVVAVAAICMPFITSRDIGRGDAYRFEQKATPPRTEININNDNDNDN